MKKLLGGTTYAAVALGLMGLTLVSSQALAANGRPSGGATSIRPILSRSLRSDRDQAVDSPHIVLDFERSLRPPGNSIDESPHILLDFERSLRPPGNSIDESPHILLDFERSLWSGPPTRT